MLENRLEKIKAFIANGYVVDIKTGLVCSPTRKQNSNELIQRGSLAANGYYLISTRLNGKTYTMQIHHLVYYLGTGNVAAEIDHINRNKTDNRIDNLREVTHNENMQNAKCKGYSYRKDCNKWRAQIMANGEKISLGSYNTEEEAKEVYLKAKKQYHIK